MKNDKNSIPKTHYIFPILSFFSQIETNYYVIFLVAFSQGIVALSDLALNYLYKDDFHLLPSEVSQLNSLTIVPWIMKPLFGLISDTFPIFGFRRKSYLFIFGSISIICWIMMAYYVNTLNQVRVFIIVNQISIAFCNVIGEALIVEISRKQSQNNNNKEAAANNVSIYFIIKYVGLLMTASSSGTLLLYIDKRRVFLITSFFPLMIVISAFLLKEESYNSNNCNSNCNGNNQMQSPKYTFHSFQDCSDDDYPSSKEYDTIPKEKKNNKTPHINDQLNLFWWFVKKKEIYNPVLFIFLFMMPPNYADPMFFFYTNNLSFSSVIMGRLKLLTGLSSLFGVWLYNVYLKSFNFKTILCGSTLMSMTFNLFSILLVLRINVLLGISDYFFCIASDSITTALGEINMMPILVLACNICPKNIEGTIYAFLISIVNLGSLFGNQSASFLSYYMGITGTNFENLVWLIIISNVCYLIPLPLLFLINDSTYTEFIDYEDRDPEVYDKILR